MHRKSKLMSKAIALFLCSLVVAPISNYAFLVNSYGSGNEILHENKHSVINLKGIEVKNSETEENITDKLTFIYTDDEDPAGSFEVTTVNGKVPSVGLFKDEITGFSHTYTVTLKENDKYTMKPVHMYIDADYGDESFAYDLNRDEAAIDFHLVTPKGNSTEIIKSDVKVTNSILQIKERNNEIHDNSLRFTLTNSKGESVTYTPGVKTGKNIKPYDDEIAINIYEGESYTLKLEPNSNYTMKDIQFSFKKTDNNSFPQAILIDGSGVLDEINLTKKNTKEEYVREILQIKEGNSAIKDTKFKFTLTDSSGEKITSESGIKTDSGVQLLSDEVSFKMKINESYTLSLEDNEKYEMDDIHFKFLKKEGDKFPWMYLNNGDDVLNDLHLTRKPEGKNICLKDIEIVDKNNKPINDNIDFEVYNMRDKGYKQSVKLIDGKLSGINIIDGVRFKIGPKDVEKYTLAKAGNINTTFNFINILSNGDNNFPVETDFRGEVKKENIEKLVLIKKTDLLGTKPENKKLANVSINIKDVSKNKELIVEDNINFEVLGGGDKQNVSSEKGRLKFNMYPGEKYNIRVVPSEKNNYRMDGMSISLNDKNNIIDGSGNILDSLNIYQGRYILKMRVTHDGYVVKPGYNFQIKGDDGSVQELKNTLGWLTFNGDRDVNYTISMPKNPTYNMEDINFVIKKYKDGYTAVLNDPKYKNDPLFTQIDLERIDGAENPNQDMERVFDPNEDSQGSPCNPNAGNDCIFANKKVTVSGLKTTESKEKEKFALKENIQFRLFNSTRQRFEDNIVSEGGAIKDFDIVKGMRYIILLADSDKYTMENNVYMEIDNNGNPYNFKVNSHIKDIVVHEKNENNQKKEKVGINIGVLYKGKVITEPVEFELASPFETIKVNSNDGRLKTELLEDITYTVKVNNNKYDVVTFPLVIKDKSEYNMGKYPYNHSTCELVENIDLLDKNEVKMYNSSVLCPSGKTKVEGMKFNNLQLAVDYVDLAKYPSLKGKDVLGLDINLKNPFRCEVSKLYGDFTITRKLENGKKVKSVYFIKDGEEKQKLEFTQDGNFAKIKADSMSMYPLVIEFEKGKGVTGSGANSSGSGSSSSSSTTIIKKEENVTTNSVFTRLQKENKVNRIAGENRKQTAVEISKKNYKKADTVIIARADSYADALASAPLAKSMNAPILLSDSNRLDDFIIQDIKRLGASNVVIVGGENSIDKNIEFTLSKIIENGVDRVAGENRYQTAEKIAELVNKNISKSNKAVVASGENWADALCASAFASKNNMPIVLVNNKTSKNEIDKQMKSLGVEKVYIIGGENSINKNIEKKLPKLIERIAGKDRYETSAKIAQYGFKDSKKAFLTSGENFADALVIGPIAGNVDAPILLSNKDESKTALTDNHNGLESLTIVGGKNSLK